MEEKDIEMTSIDVIDVEAVENEEKNIEESEE